MPTTPRPNIVLVLSDEHHVEALGCSNALPLRTPHIDRLAAEGTRFTSAWCCSSICSPSRAAVFTGLLPHRFGTVRNDLTIPPGTPNLASLLGAAGYRLGYAGKWHVDKKSLPTSHGFIGKDVPGYGDPSPVFREPVDHAKLSAKPYNHYYRYLMDRGLGVPELVETQGAFLSERASLKIHGRHTGGPESSISYFVAEEAISLIDRFASEQPSNDRPFFLWTNFWGPHNACHVPEPYYSMYDPASIPEPPGFADSLDGKPHIQKYNSLYWGCLGAPWSYWQQHLARYFGAVTLIDDQVGRIRAALERTGQFENTLFIFASDHGDMIGRHQLMDKGAFMYDDTYRLPLIVRGPGVRQGVRDQFVYLHDLFPTLLDWAGVAQPPDRPAMDEAQSLLPLLNGRGNWSERDAIFGEFDDQIFPFPQRMIRTHTHKLVYNLADRAELYDLERDPHELHNRIADPAYTAIKRDLAARLLRHLEATADPLARHLSRIAWAI